MVWFLQIGTCHPYQLQEAVFPTDDAARLDELGTTLERLEEAGITLERLDETGVTLDRLDELGITLERLEELGTTLERLDEVAGVELVLPPPPICTSIQPWNRS